MQICRISLFLQHFGIYVVGSAPEVQEDTKMGGIGRIVFLTYSEERKVILEMHLYKVQIMNIENGPFTVVDRNTFYSSLGK